MKGEKTIRYNVKLNMYQEHLLHLMIVDKEFWPGEATPKDITQLLEWAITDYIDYYQSYNSNKKGEK